MSLCKPKSLLKFTLSKAGMPGHEYNEAKVEKDHWNCEPEHDLPVNTLYLAEIQIWVLSAHLW